MDFDNVKNVDGQLITVKGCSLKRNSPSGTLTQEMITLTFSVFTPLFANMLRLAPLFIRLDNWII